LLGVVDRFFELDRIPNTVEPLCKQDPKPFAGSQSRLESGLSSFVKSTDEPTNEGEGSTRGDISKDLRVDETDGPCFLPAGAVEDATGRVCYAKTPSALYLMQML
jgi:hypothetical protein